MPAEGTKQKKKKKKTRKRGNRWTSDGSGDKWRRVLGVRRERERRTVKLRKSGRTAVAGFFLFVKELLGYNFFSTELSVCLNWHESDGRLACRCRLAAEYNGSSCCCCCCCCCCFCETVHWDCLKNERRENERMSKVRERHQKREKMNEWRKSSSRSE
mgnify:CR=1 FL=1